MIREFKFFRGYSDDQLIQTTYYPAYAQWVPGYGHTTITPDLYVPPNYTITTTPSYGTFTIPYSGQLIGTTTMNTLTTSNPDGITYTTGGFGGTLTTGTATYTSDSFKN